MIANEAHPSLLRIRLPSGTVTSVIRDGVRRDPDSDFQFQFVSDALLSPRRILRGHPPDQLAEFLGQARSSRRLRLPTPELPESFAVPADEGIRFDYHQRHPPIEQPTHRDHQPSGSVVGPMWFDLPLLEERQLLPQEQVLGRQGTAGIGNQTDGPKENEEDGRCRPEAMPQGDEEEKRS
jgi:hypothetical protein